MFYGYKESIRKINVSAATWESTVSVLWRSNPEYYSSTRSFKSFNRSIAKISTRSLSYYLVPITTYYIYSSNDNLAKIRHTAESVKKIKKKYHKDR